jgi:hypothetical protein
MTQAAVPQRRQGLRDPSHPMITVTVTAAAPAPARARGGSTLAAVWQALSPRRRRDGCHLPVARPGGGEHDARALARTGGRRRPPRPGPGGAHCRPQAPSHWQACDRCRCPAGGRRPGAGRGRTFKLPSLTSKPMMPVTQEFKLPVNLNPSRPGPSTGHLARRTLRYTSTSMISYMP